MGHPLRFQPEPWQTFEVTTRCLQARYLLLPGEEANRRFVGVLARAQELYGEHVRLHFVAGTSNHFHAHVSFRDAAWGARWKDHVKTNLSKEMGDLHGWDDHLFGRRSRDIPILDDDATLDRVRYLLGHGIKENLVGVPEAWPGPPFVRAVTEGVRLVGVWYDRSRLNGMNQAWKRRKAEKRGDAPTLQDVAEEKVLTLAPLPLWAELPEAEQRARWSALRDEVVERYRAENPGAQPLGAEAVLAQDPHHRPECAKKSPAPAVHARLGELAKLWRAAYAAFMSGWRDAMARLTRGLRPFAFPEGGVLPPRAMAVAFVAMGEPESFASG